MLQPEMALPARRRRRPPYAALLIAVALVVAVAWGITARLAASAQLKQQTLAQAMPVVAVMTVPQGPPQDALVLPGTLQAWHEATLYARTSGYLKNWVSDIGAEVKKGALLAEIATPEVDAQYHQAQAELASAIANNQLAQVTAVRWKKLLKTQDVSRQDADQKVSDAAAKAALVASAQANLAHLRELKNFQRVTAPFDGVITARNTDNGALISAGSATTLPELFHIAEIDTLRVYVRVPERDSAAIVPGMVATLHFTEHPGISIPATLTETAHALDPASRTLLVELKVDNSQHLLMPGSYAEVHIPLAAAASAATNPVRIPANALLFRAEGMQVAGLDPQNQVLLKPITIGRDFGKEVEVTAGLNVGDTIILNPPDSLLAGQAVKVAQAPAPPPPAPETSAKTAEPGKAKE